LSGVEVRVSLDESLPGCRVEGFVRTTAQTGVEMEALTAVSVALLTIYDMAKAVDRTMVISDIVLREKRGGTRGDFISGP
jgi:cyclic pyranopterin phosphate synthase